MCAEEVLQSGGEEKKEEERSLGVDRVL